MASVSAAPEIATIGAALSVHGLLPRCGFVFAKNDSAPRGLLDSPARSVLLVGNAGPAMWPHFQRWLADLPQRKENPLDQWSRQIIGEIADRFGARAVSPSDKPWLPFQQWAMRAEGLKPSPLGILMHPRFGLWHAYRGALLFDTALAFEAPAEAIHVCDSCATKPCKGACPVAAHAGDRFDYAGCVSHVRGAFGAECRTAGCFDRNACPFCVEHRYSAEQQAFHMASFAG